MANQAEKETQQLMEAKALPPKYSLAITLDMSMDEWSEVPPPLP